MKDFLLARKRRKKGNTLNPTREVKFKRIIHIRSFLLFLYVMDFIVNCFFFQYNSSTYCKNYVIIHQEVSGSLIEKMRQYADDGY